ncbi:Ankyrin repeat domain-containing protein 54 [Phytophthora citrophthora]|uniref:Ankyrin repeat domain-containing protein 54 n=1 Tax=Phytophthora citrophthora TaxID=4793 RepID=A0AAD9LVE9_9STRA|nr:Ankyrin repeat domain-containing protein 54 [Phytophthora citrophthora]
MKQLLILVAQHPLKVGAVVLLLSVFYSFARVLALQYVVGALQDAILRYPKNFPHAFFLPLFHVSLVAAATAALYQDYRHSRFWVSPTSTQLWKHVLPLPLTLHHGKWSRLVGIPLYAFTIALVEAVLVFRDPTMESVTKTIARRFFQRTPELEEEFYPPKFAEGAMFQDRADMAWKILTGGSLATEIPSTNVLSYIRLLIEIFVAAGVCASFALARFFREPQHGTFEILCQSNLFCSVLIAWYFLDGDELREAARNNDILGVKLLLARGMDPDASSGDGTTALHVCAQQAIDRAAQVLLEHGADANVSDRLGFTPLHWAVQMRREEVSTASRLATIRILLHHGANPRKPDSSGTTPLLIASRKENEASLGVLKEFLPEGETAGEVETTEMIDEVNSEIGNSE